MPDNAQTMMRTMMTRTQDDMPKGAAMLARPAVLVILLIGTAIAFILPFDANIAALTGSSRTARAALTAAVVLLGAWFAQRAGLRLEGHSSRSPALLGTMAALGMTAYILLLDCVLFRTMLTESYVEFLRMPLAERYAYFMLRAFNENIVYRLFAFSGLLWLVTLAWGRRRVPVAAIVACMVLAQVSNIWPNVVSLSPHPTAAMLGYDTMRYIVPGVAWAILYLRNGFAVAEIASVGCHLFLQPPLGALI